MVIERDAHSAFSALRERDSWNPADAVVAAEQMHAWTRRVDDICHAFVTPPVRSFGSLRVGVKDTIDVQGWPTGLGVAGYAPPEAPSSAAIVRRVPRGSIVGKTVTTELSIGLEHGTVNLAFPFVDPGGSSTGSAVAVATGMCDIALGTDSVASVRIPAAATGVVGLRATRRAGDLKPGFGLSGRLDAVGWFARTPDDLATAWNAWIEPSSAVPSDVRHLRVVVADDAIAEVLDRDMADATEATAEALRAAGAEVVRGELGPLFSSRRVAYDVCVSDARRSLGERVWLQPLLSASTLRALSLRVGVARHELDSTLIRLRAEAREMLNGRTIWLLPAGAQAPLDLREESLPDSTIPSRASPVPANFLAMAAALDLPSISVPVAHDARAVPLSVQVVGAPGSDAELIATAAAITASLGLPPLMDNCLRALEGER